jgi:LmbE family N-acetylglucosaminyl deacetylase
MARPVIFYAPHADDETLNMGITIAEHVAAGRDTHVVLLTHGRQTGAINVINGDHVNGGYFWEIKHDPAIEGYEPITVDEMAEARVREFYNACGQLGVPVANRHVHYLDDPASDGGESITYNEAKAIIQSYIDQYPDADHYTLSYHDIHPDHAACGQALRDLYNEGAITYNVRFVISVATLNDLKAQGKPMIGAKDLPTNADITKRVRNACRCYAAWAPNVDSYAVGYHSVSQQFDQFLADPFHYVHLIGV